MPRDEDEEEKRRNKLGDPIISQLYLNWILTGILEVTLNPTLTSLRRNKPLVKPFSYRFSVHLRPPAPANRRRGIGLGEDNCQNDTLWTFVENCHITFGGLLHTHHSLSRLCCPAAHKEPFHFTWQQPRIIQ